MAALIYQCAECNQTLMMCTECGLIVHVAFYSHECTPANAGKMRVCPYEVIAADVPEVRVA